MFSYTSYGKADKSEGTISLKRRWPTLGPNEDTDGNMWDIAAFGGQGGKGWCSAIPLGELHEYFTDTTGRGFGLVSQRWNAYQWEFAQ